MSNKEIIEKALEEAGITGFEVMVKGKIDATTIQAAVFVSENEIYGIHGSKELTDTQADKLKKALPHNFSLLTK